MSEKIKITMEFTPAECAWIIASLSAMSRIAPVDMRGNFFNIARRIDEKVIKSLDGHLGSESYHEFMDDFEMKTEIVGKVLDFKRRR